MSRRAFLRRAALGVPAIGAVLAACRASPSKPSLPVASQQGPTSIFPNGSEATLRVYEWKDYLARDVLDSFERSFADRKVRVEVESFLHIDEAVARLQDPASDFDVFFPTIDVLPELIAAGLLLPLDHDRLANLENLWSWFTTEGGPFYDPGQRFTIPYTVYSSGVGWRADLVDPSDVPGDADPYAILWNGAYRNKLGIYDNYLEALSLALLRSGVQDLHAASDAQLAAAADSLAEAVRRVGLRFTDDGAEEGLPEGIFAAHQAWSGDILTAPRYASSDPEAAAGLEHLRYWSPAGRAKVVGCDLTAICTRGSQPELAHAFLNHLMDFPVAMDNFAWNGYQPPVTGLNADAFADPSFVWYEAVPAYLLDTLLTQEAFAEGQILVGFGPAERARWLAQWNLVPVS